MRSKLEERVGTALSSLGTTFAYEPKQAKLGYIQPEKKRTYLPDFVLEDGTIIEVKGRLTREDREKLVNIRRSNPDKKIVLVFGRAKNKLTKATKTTYADWAKKNGFPWVDFEEYEKDGIWRKQGIGDVGCLPDGRGKESVKRHAKRRTASKVLQS